MTRLIDADALLDFLDVGHLRPPTEICFSELMMKNIIDIQPTVDAVPVIRCKDCKHWLPHAQFGFDEDNNEYHNYCALLVPEDDDYYAFTREADEFCSRAERKDI